MNKVKIIISEDLTTKCLEKSINSFLIYMHEETFELVDIKIDILNCRACIVYID